MFGGVHDTGALGHELNALVALNFVDDLIRRDVTYSDGRHFTKAGLKQEAPDRQPVKDFQEGIVGR
ncbi:MAG TPA: hypothetical protein VHZ97_16055 [Pseudonocardiaceae bacterium]|nr:hypothetical protein [Pseudonocardiaceae bacterium]